MLDCQKPALFLICWHIVPIFHSVGDEKLNFSQRDASRVEQVCTLEERLKLEKEKTIESSKDQSVFVARLEERIYMMGLERDDVPLKLEEN